MAVRGATNLVFSFIVSYTSLCLLLLLSHCHAHKTSAYEAIYQFGDSMSDTGNFIIETPSDAAARFPYGETYFNKPTGRASDGRLMIDFLAQELGLPLLNPYLGEHSSLSHFRHGADFAVGGATALGTDFLDNFNITGLATNSSLHVQLDWFFTHIESMCSNKIECEERIKKALFVVGEIGFNDYAYAFFEGKSIDKVRPLVPYVIKEIKHAVEKLIKSGATQLIVPGNFAVGCMPGFLTLFKNNDSTYYDDTKCLRSYNEFAEYHNNYLKTTLYELSQENPHVVILYADYYNAFQSILNSGFEKEHVLKACCGTGMDYNFDVEKPCGVGGASSCPDPTQYISWDGVHFTEMGFRLMFKWMLKNNLSKI